MRQLVEKALNGKRGSVGVRRPERALGNVVRQRRRLKQQVRDVTRWKSAGSLIAMADEPAVPCDQLSVAVDPAAKQVTSPRTIPVMLDVVLATPKELNRRAFHPFGDRNRFCGI